MIEAFRTTPKHYLNYILPYLQNKELTEQYDSLRFIVMFKS